MNAIFFRFSAARLAACLLLFGAALASCKKDVTLKNLDVKLQQDLIVDVRDTMPDTGAWTTELVPDDNADVRDNRKKINDITINKAAYVVSDYTGDSAYTGTGTWKFYPSDNPNDVTSLATATAINFSSMRANGAELDLNLSDDAKGKLIQYINGKKNVTFVFDGHVSGKPVWVRFNIRIYTKLRIGL